MLFVTGKSYKFKYKYKNVLNKVQLMASINLVHVLVKGCHSQGILKIKEMQAQRANSGVWLYRTT